MKKGAKAMKAIQFIKDHGVDKAREVVERSSFGTHYKVDTGEVICCHNENHFYFVGQIKLGIEFIRIDDLKRLVKSVERVHSYGGLGLIEYQVRCLGQELSDSLRQAIADYESIYSNDCEILDHPEDYTSPNCKKFDERVGNNETK